MSDRPVDQPAPEFRRLHPLTPLARGWTILAVVGALVLSQFLGEPETRSSWWLWIIAASVPVALVYGIGSWLFTKYAIVGGDLRIETGLLFKRSRVVDLDRLESVDVVQPLVPRLLGLAEVRLEVAGGSSTEAPLAYLAVADARELKARLLALRVGVPTREVQPEEKLLVRVPVERLVIAALLSGAWLASVVAGGLLVLDMVLGGGAVIGLFLPAVFGAVRGVLDHDLVGELIGLLEVLRREQDIGARGDEGPDRIPQLDAGARVEARRRFVEEQQAGCTDEAGAEVEAASHPARVAAHEAVGGVGEVEAVEYDVGGVPR